VTLDDAWSCDDQRNSQRRGWGREFDSGQAGSCRVVSAFLSTLPMGSMGSSSRTWISLGIL
jgi:hypothetical protein